MLNKEEFILHRNKITKNMPNDSVLVLFAKTPSEFKEAPNKNFYYATGIKECDDICFIVKENDVITTKILIQKYDEFKAKWVGTSLNSEEVLEISGCDIVDYIDNFYSVLEEYINLGYLIYFDFEDVNHKSYAKSELDGLVLYLKEKYPYIKIENGRKHLKNARTIKTEAEIEEIKKAIEQTRLGIESLMKNSKPGLYEYQLESYFDKEIKYYGADGYAFNTIAASGKNATCLHYSTNNSIINDGDLILFDLGSTNNHYCADISRTFPASGKFTSRQKELYNIVLNCQKKVFESIKPGLTTKDLNNIVIDYYKVELKRIGLIKDDSEVRKYYFHGVSHHLGLDCHDLCDYTPLEAGCVISNEPGLYIPQENIGIRIEDDVLVTKDGCVNLSSSIIKEIDDIENFMKK